MIHTCQNFKLPNPTSDRHTVNCTVVLLGVPGAKWVPWMHLAKETGQAGELQEEARAKTDL